MKDPFLKLLAGAPVSIIAFFAPINALCFALGLFVLVDLVTGIWASVKAGKRITSRRFGHTITKTVVYLIAIVVARIAEQHVMPDVPVLKVVSGIIGSTELLSLYENLSRISGVDFKRRLIGMLSLGRNRREETNDDS